MHPYLPNTPEDVQEMLGVIGVESTEALFKSIPDNVRLQKDLNLPKSKSEIEVRSIVSALASKNESVDELTCFLGAGSYDHYIPSIIRTLVTRSEFYTAYTPYQPEISQGTLQSVFEYQSMMCALTGMEVSNVSMYDAPTAAAEGAILASVQTKRKQILVSKTVHPETRAVLETYLKFRNVDILFVDEKDGVTDVSDLQQKLTADVAGVVLQYPNF